MQYILKQYKGNPSIEKFKAEFEDLQLHICVQLTLSAGAKCKRASEKFKFEEVIYTR